MNFEEVIFMMLMGIVLYLVLIWGFFWDFIGVALKILPLNPPRGYQRLKKIWESERFQNHKKKWIRKYLSLIIIYVVVYMLVTIMMNDYTWGFLVAFVVLILSFAKVGDIEYKERKEIENS